MNSIRPDVVFDCNIFLQAATSTSGPAAQALRLAERNIVTLHVSKRILRELRRTLAYPEIRRRNPHVTDEAIDAFIRRISFRGVMHRNVPRVFEFARDPDGEPYVAVASADFLVTRDRDLLYLQSERSSEANGFRRQFRKLALLDPADFLKEIERLRPGVFKEL
jgi:putative PIN family toxin of toxin-antitoxin system